MGQIPKYNYAFANYPLGFRGCVISPTKICMQFADPMVKLRLLGQPGDDLPGKYKYLPVGTGGVNILTTAVGCQMPVLEKVQLELISAYNTYYMCHKDCYKNTYGKNFIDFIRKLKTEINNLSDVLEHEEAKLNGSS